GRNDFADFVLDILKDALGGFDAGLRRRADVEPDLAAVDRGEEVPPDYGQHPTSQREHQRGDHRDDEPPLEQDREHANVAAAEALEAAVEAGVKPREPAFRALAMALALEQEADDD